MAFGSKAEIGNTQERSKSCQTLASMLPESKLPLVYVEILQSPDHKFVPSDAPSAQNQKSKPQLKRSSRLPNLSEATKLKNRRGKGVPPRSTSPNFNKAASAYDQASELLPMCMAIMPCKYDDPRPGTLMQELTFGFHAENGIPIAEIYKVLKLKLNGVMFNSMGRLTPPTFDPPLPKAMQPIGMDMALTGTAEVAFGTKNHKFLEVGFTSTIGMLSKLNGRSISGEALSFLFGPDGMQFEYIEDKLKNLINTDLNLRVQMFASGSTSITLNFESLTGIKGAKLDVSAAGPGLSVSAMLDVELVTTAWHPFMPQVTTMTAAWGISRKFVLRHQLDFLFDTLGPLGKALKATFSAVQASIQTTVLEKTYLRVSTDGFMFSYEFSGSTKFNCGPIIGVFSDIIKLIEEKMPAGEELTKGLLDLFEPIKKILDEICAPDATLDVGVGIAFDNHGLVKDDTFIKFMKYTLKMSDIPSCPPPVRPGEACSTNSDCNGPEYPDGGYCLNHPEWKTSIACLGKCIKKLPNGERCDKDAMNLPPWAKLDVGNAEKEACISNECLCGSCGSVADGFSCATNDNCQSGFCKGYSTTGCTGTCLAPIDTGGDCSPGAVQELFGALPWSAAHEACKYNACYCNRCVSSSGGLPKGYACSENSDCESSRCKAKPCASSSLGESNATETTVSRRLLWAKAVKAVARCIGTTVDCNGTCE